MAKKIIYYILGILIIAGAIYFAFGHSKSAVQAPNINIDPNTLAGIQTGNYPWLPEINNLKTRLQKIGLPALSQEGTALHTHQHLDIFINGQQIAIPANTGIDDAKGFISPIHTHEETGIIHVESPVAQKFYLGQFFDIWGLRLTSECVGGYCNNNDQVLKVFVNGTLFAGDPRLIELQAHQEIAVTYGTIKQLPFPAPNSYTFPAGY